MKSCPPDEPTLRRFIAAIDQLPPRPHHSGLLDAAGRLLPACAFRYALSRGGWYRPGGVIEADGRLVADDVEAWLDAERVASGDDIDVFLERHGGDGLLVTRHIGQTHYFVAPYGPEPADFLQLEVEELREVLDRQLVNADALPDDFPELGDPFRPASLPAQAVGRPHYHFRRLVDMRRVASRVAGTLGGIAPLNRFFAEWATSRAAGKGCCSDHWIVGLREHQDRYGNPVTNAMPMSRHGRKLQHFHWSPAARGVILSEQVQAFDRAAGYPSAWYFHLVAGALMPRDLAYALMDDVDAGFRYLADPDIQLLRGWIAQPYSC